MLATVEEMKPTLKTSQRAQEDFVSDFSSNVDNRLSHVLEAVRQKIDGNETPIIQCGDVVLVAVTLSRLNSQNSYFIAGVFTIVENGHGAILRAPRNVAEWLRDDGVSDVAGLEPTPEPVQIIEQDTELPVLEIAVILWEPLNADSVYGRFEDAFEAATQLTSG